MEEAQEGLDGYISTEVFPPIAGIQDNWTAVVRFDSTENLDNWMNSASRQDLLRKGNDIFEDMSIRKVETSFGAWFPPGNKVGMGSNSPANWKQTLAVFAALYPLTLVITLWITEPYIDTLSTSLLIGDAISVALLSYFVMPFTNRILHFWLIPKKASWRIALVGVLVLAVFTALVWYVFGLVPVKVGY